ELNGNSRSQDRGVCKLAGRLPAARCPRFGRPGVSDARAALLLPGPNPWGFNFTAASLRELASGTWLAKNNSSMAAMSRARLYGDEPVRTQFPKFRGRESRKKHHENSYCDH